MKAVDFYKLPRAIQDRFVGSVMSGFPPAPILVVKGGTSQKLMWLALSAASFVVLLVVTRLGYGDLESILSLHSGKVLPVYLLLVFGFAFGLVQAFARVVRERALPYTAGVYLFPACLIDARDDQFKVHETRDLTSCDVVGSAIRVGFAGGVTFLSRPRRRRPRSSRRSSARVTARCTLRRPRIRRSSSRSTRSTTPASRARSARATPMR